MRTSIIRTMDKDFLDEQIAEQSKQDPSFEEKIDAALERRVLARQLTEKRKTMNLSQQAVADMMKSTQPIVSKIESGADVQISTVLRYAAVLKAKLEFKFS